MALLKIVNGAPLMYRTVVARVAPAVFGISARAAIDRMWRRSTLAGPRHRSRFGSVRTWNVFLSAWFSAVPRDDDKEYEILPDQLSAYRFSSERFNASYTESPVFSITHTCCL